MKELRKQSKLNLDGVFYLFRKQYINYNYLFGSLLLLVSPLNTLHIVEAISHPNTPITTMANTNPSHLANGLAKFKVKPVAVGINNLLSALLI